MNTRSLGKVLTAARSYQQWHDQSRSMRDRATGNPFFRQPSPLLSVITQAKGQQLGVCWRQTSNTAGKSPELRAGLVQDELCGEAAAPTIPRLPHLSSRSWCFPPKARYCCEAQGTAKRCLVKNHLLAFPGFPISSFTSNQSKAQPATVPFQRLHVLGLWDLTVHQCRSWTRFWAAPFPDWNRTSGLNKRSKWP